MQRSQGPKGKGRESGLPVSTKPELGRDPATRTKLPLLVSMGQALREGEQAADLGSGLCLPLLQGRDPSPPPPLEAAPAPGPCQGAHSLLT